MRDYLGVCLGMSMNRQRVDLRRCLSGASKWRLHISTMEAINSSARVLAEQDVLTGTHLNIRSRISDVLEEQLKEDLGYDS